MTSNSDEIRPELLAEDLPDPEPKHINPCFCNQLKERKATFVIAILCLIIDSLVCIITLTVFMGVRGEYKKSTQLVIITFIITTFVGILSDGFLLYGSLVKKQPSISRFSCLTWMIIRVIIDGFWIASIVLILSSGKAFTIFLIEMVVWFLWDVFTFWIVLCFFIWLTKLIRMRKDRDALKQIQADKEVNTITINPS